MVAVNTLPSLPDFGTFAELSERKLTAHHVCTRHLSSLFIDQWTRGCQTTRPSPARTAATLVFTAQKHRNIEPMPLPEDGYQDPVARVF